MNLETKEQMNEAVLLIQTYSKESLEYQELWGKIIERYKSYIYSVVGRNNSSDDMFQEFCITLPKLFDRYTGEQDFHTYLAATLRFFCTKWWNGKNTTITHNKQYMKKQHKEIEEGTKQRTMVPIEMNFVEFDGNLDSRIYGSDIESEIFLDECWNKIKEVPHSELWWDRNVNGHSPAELMEKTGFRRTQLDCRLRDSGNSIIPVLREVINENLDYIVTEDKTRTILTRQQVEEIKLKYVPRYYTASKLAKEYNTSSYVIDAILHDRAYPSGYTS